MDREKVINELRFQLNSKEVKEHHDPIQLSVRDAEKILSLLKEQEAVEPVEEFIKGTNCHYYHCKRCENIVGTILDDKHPIFPGVKLSIKHFCDMCGQAVKWGE